MHGCADHRAGNPQPLGAVALHLGSQHQFRCRFGHGRFHRQVVVTDQGLQAQGFGGSPHGPGHFTAVGAQPHHRETQFLAADPGRGEGVTAVAKDEHPLAREVRGVHGFRIPGQA